MGGGDLSHRLAFASVGACSLDNAEMRGIWNRKYYPSSLHYRNWILHCAMSIRTGERKIWEIKQTEKNNVWTLWIRQFSFSEDTLPPGLAEYFQLCAVGSTDILQGKHYLSWKCNQSKCQRVHPGAWTESRAVFIDWGLIMYWKDLVTWSQKVCFFRDKQTHINTHIITIMWLTNSAQNVTPCDCYHGNLLSIRYLSVSQEWGARRHSWLLLTLNAATIGALSLRLN